MLSARGLSFDDVGLVPLAGGALALASHDDGLFVRRVDAEGHVLAPTQRIAERCTGGLDAAILQDDVLVVCLRPGNTREASVGHAVALYRLSATGQVIATSTFGAAGSNSRGVALALLGAQVFVGFQDAIVGESRTWLASFQLTSAGMAEPELRVLSDAAFRGGPPSLGVRAGQLYGAWAETRDDGSGRVMWSVLSRRGRALALFATRDPSPSPSLVTLPAHAREQRDVGDFALSFRDVREKHRKTGLYLAAIDGDGSVRQKPRRIARADGVARPAVRVCGSGAESAIIVATPRTFAREYLVGALSVDPTLQHVSGEQQFYEDTREFFEVGLACLPKGPLLVIAERGKLGQSHAALRAVPFSCR